MRIMRSFHLLAMATVLAAPDALAADAENGKAVFDRLCISCHSTTTEAGSAVTGPTLAGVVGRKAASATEFTMYTPAMKNHNVKWNAKTLHEYLANPMTTVPGTIMVMPVPDAEERADLIAYLETLKGK